MVEVIILKDPAKEYHPLLMDATRRSIGILCPVSSIIESCNFPKDYTQCFVVAPGDIFIRSPYKLLDTSGTFSYITLDVAASGISGTYYSREVASEYQFKESPIYYNRDMGDPVGVYIKEPVVVRLKHDSSLLDEQLALNKQININKFFYNNDVQDVSFEFRR